MNLIALKTNPADQVTKDSDYNYFLHFLENCRWNDKLPINDTSRCKSFLVKIDKALESSGKRYAHNIYNLIFSGHSANFKPHIDNFAKQLWIDFFAKYPIWVLNNTVKIFISETAFPSIFSYKKIIKERTNYYDIKRLLALKHKLSD